jgi:hypothetical protein
MSKQMTKGEKIGEILEEIEMCMWEHQANDPGEPLKFNETALRAATKIFADILMEFSYRHRKSNKQKLEDMALSAVELGQAIRFLIRNNTGIDSTTWYKEENE